jgi:hypothetical protein
MVTLAVDKPAVPPMQGDTFLHHTDNTTAEIEQMREEYLSLNPDRQAQIRRFMEAFGRQTPSSQRRLLRLFQRSDADPNFAEEA